MTNERILVVDDEKGVVHSCVRILQRQGFNVSGITDSQSVPALLRQESFDLLLTDIRMPKVDGLALLQIAKEIDPHLTVVLITGYGTMEDAINAIRLGAQGFLMKPFEPDDLVAAIKDNLARRALIRDSLRLQTLLPLLEINQILQVSGGETSLVRQVMEIAQRETGAARIAWLSCGQPPASFYSASPLYPDLLTAPPAMLPTRNGRLEIVEVVVIPQLDQPSRLPHQAVERVLAQAQPIWVLVDGALIETAEGQSSIVGAVLPLMIKGEIIGLLTAETGHAGRTGPFNQISLDLLSVLAGQLTIIIENVQLFQQTESLRSFNEDIIRNMTNGLIAIDQASHITAFNPAASSMLGCQTDRVLHRSLPDVVSGADELIRVFHKTLTTGKPCTHQEITIRHWDGNYLPVSVSTAPLGLSEANQKPMGVVGVLEDLSEIKALEAERRRLDRLAALGEMSAVVAHEIRNPIAAIAAGVDYLTRNLTKDSPEFEGVTMIYGEIERVNRILEDILFVARPTRLNLSSEDLAEIIEKVIQRCRSPIEESQVIVSTEYAPDLPALKVDRQRLEQVFTNLIINATQAMPGGGRLSLQTQVSYPHCLSDRRGQEGEEVVITISDTGPGIPKETQRQIFEPFFTTKARGTGLGLSVARRIIEEHGGSIGIENNEIDRGARFIIKLPVAERITS